MIKILLVDDDRDFHGILKGCLESKGYDVVSAFDGKQALALLEEEVADLIIADILMPEIDGLDLIFKILKSQDHFPCKIIAISGGGRITAGEYLGVAETAGIDAVLEKPFKVKDLEEHIKRLFPQQ